MASKEATIEWRKNNPERYKAYKAKDQKKRYDERWSLKNQIKTLITAYPERKGLTYEDVLEIYNNQLGCCALSGVTLTWVRGKGRVPTNLSIDRIEAGGPYIKENIQLVCRIINVMKTDMTDTELLWWCTQVVEQKGIK